MNKSVNIEHYIERLENGHRYDSLIDEMLRGDSFSTDSILKFTRAEAAKEREELLGEEEFDADLVFRDIWKTTEKGLS